MANNIINSKVDPGIATVKPIAAGSIASSTTVNTSVDPQLSKNKTIIAPAVNVVSTNKKDVTVPSDSVPDSVSINNIVEAIIKNYLDSSGSGTSSTGRVADVANSVAYANVTGRPNFATVATTGSYNDLLNLPSIPNFASYATQSYVNSAINNLVDGAPVALDTLKELAASISNNSSYASSIITLLAGKVNTSDLSSYATTTYVDNKTTWANISDKPVLFSGSYIDLTNKPAIPDTQIQSDWTQSTNTALDFIRNKPTLVTNLDSLSDVTITSAASGQVLKFNGTTWINDTDTTGGGASTGNITFSDTTMASTNGNVKISFSPTASPAVEFTFADNGSFITNAIRGTSEVMSFLNTDGVGIRIDSANEPTSIDIGDTTEWDYVRLRFGTGSVTGNGGDVEIRSTPMDPDNLPPSAISISPQGGMNGSFTFAGDGNLTLPRGGIINETNIPDGDLTGNTIALMPSGGVDPDQKLLVYPTAVGSDNNHLHLTSGNLYNTELYLGNDDLYVKLANTGNIIINSNDDTGNIAQWTFGIDGNLTFPDASVQNTAWTGSLSTLTNGIYSASLNNTGALVIPSQAGVQPGKINAEYAVQLNSLYTSGRQSGHAEIRGDGFFITVGLADNANPETNTKDWSFDNTGNLTIPAGGEILDSDGVKLIRKEQSFEAVSSTNFNALSGHRYGIDTSGGVVNVRLPANPEVGDAIYFMDFGGAYSTNNLNILRGGNGQEIMGETSDLTVGTDGQSFGLAWAGTTWRIY